MQNINEWFEVSKVSPGNMDYLWSIGWRHFGTYFFRYNHIFTWNGSFSVLPLRIKLADISLSNSQKRVIKKNSDLKCVIRDSFIDDSKEEMFERHKSRFKENIPNSIHNFFSYNPARVPCETKEICLYQDERMLAVTFLDLGDRSTSSVYSIYEPDETKRSLGIYLILLSIDYSIREGKIYYYPGYAYKEPSHYDYKKRFYGLEYYNWQDSWIPYNFRSPNREES